MFSQKTADGSRGKMKEVSARAARTLAQGRAERQDRLVLKQGSKVLKTKLRALAFGQSGLDLKPLVRRFDTNNSRKLELNEWRELIRAEDKEGGCALRKDMLTEKDLKALFFSIDVNEDGGISVEELATFVNQEFKVQDLGPNQDKAQIVTNAVSAIKRNFRAASYSMGRQDLRILLGMGAAKKLGRDNSGAFDLDAYVSEEMFRATVRRTSWTDMTRTIFFHP